MKLTVWLNNYTQLHKHCAKGTCYHRVKIFTARNFWWINFVSSMSTDENFQQCPQVAVSPVVSHSLAVCLCCCCPILMFQLFQHEARHEDSKRTDKTKSNLLSLLAVTECERLWFFWLSNYSTSKIFRFLIFVAAANQRKCFNSKNFLIYGITLWRPAIETPNTVLFLDQFQAWCNSSKLKG